MRCEVIVERCQLAHVSLPFSRSGSARSTHVAAPTLSPAARSKRRHWRDRPGCRPRRGRTPRRAPLFGDPSGPLSTAFPASDLRNGRRFAWRRSARTHGRRGSGAAIALAGPGACCLVHAAAVRHIAGTRRLQRAREFACPVRPMRAAPRRGSRDRQRSTTLARRARCRDGGARPGSVNTSVATAAVTNMQSSGPTRRAGSRRPARRRQSLRHARRRPLLEPAHGLWVPRLRVVAQLEQCGICGCAAEVTVRPQRASGLGGTPQSGPGHRRRPEHRDGDKNVVDADRLGPSSALRRRRAINPAEPHNANRAAAKKRPRHNRRRTARSKDCTV